MNEPKRSTAFWLSVLLMICLFAFPALAQGGSVSGIVFADNDANGLPDKKPAFLDGAEVTLVSLAQKQETIVSSATTGQDGAFSFTNLPSGDYYLRILYPSGYIASPQAEEGSIALPSCGSGSRTSAFTLTEGKSLESLLLGGTKRSGFVRVTAFLDENANGGRFSSEPALPNIPVELYYDDQGNSYLVGSTKTNKEGIATLSGVTPGTYRVAVTVPSPYIIGPLGNKITPFFNCIIPSDSERGFSAPFTVQAGSSVGLGASGVKTGTLEGSLWLDANSDGQKDKNEAPFEQALVSLSSEALGVKREAIATASGRFSFDRLQSGQYQLTVTLPDGFMFTPFETSLMHNSLLSEDHSTFSVVSGETKSLKAIGVAPATSLTVHAFHDANVDGQYSADDRPYAGAKVDITLPDKKTIELETDAEGLATIHRLPAGTVSIRCRLSNEQVFSIGTTEDHPFSSPIASDDQTVSYTLSAGTKAKVQVGITLPSAITGTLFHDENLNGIRDKKETALEGFIVEALNEKGEAVQKQTTDKDGFYTLSPLIPGKYSVRISLTPPYVFSAYSDTKEEIENKIKTQTPQYGETEPLPLKPGETLAHCDAGAFRSAVINGKVLLGDERDAFAGNQGGLAGVQITLLDEQGQPYAAHTVAETAQDGSFSLKGALPGTYSLRYTLPENAAFSQPLLDTPIFDSKPFTVKTSDVLTEKTIYAVKTGILSGTIFMDLNADTLLNKQDTPLAGALITLTRPNGETLEASSDASGLYRLNRIRPDEYAVTLTLPDGMLVSKSTNSPFPAALSSVSSSKLSFEMGTVFENRDVAVSPAAQGLLDLYLDQDLSGKRTEADAPAAAIKGQLKHTNTGFTYDFESDAQGKAAIPLLLFGEYTLSLTLPKDHIALGETLRPVATRWQGSITVQNTEQNLSIPLARYASISGEIWNLGGGNEETDGIQLSLLRVSDGKEIGTRTSDAQGAYCFDYLMPGQYRITATLQKDYRFARLADTHTRVSIITSDKQSAPLETGHSIDINLNMGEQKKNQDIGMGAMGSLGDTAWLDTNHNGMQDLDEPGIPDILITLYQYGQKITEGKTDAYGRYLLTNLFPGEYTVEVTMPPELKATLKQKDFPLVASCLPEEEGTTLQCEGILVPSKSHNLNCDFGFVLRQQNVYPNCLKNLPVKDWTPYAQKQP